MLRIQSAISQGAEYRPFKSYPRTVRAVGIAGAITGITFLATRRWTLGLTLTPASVLVTTLAQRALSNESPKVADYSNGYHPKNAHGAIQYVLNGREENWATNLKGAEYNEWKANDHMEFGYYLGNLGGEDNKVIRYASLQVLCALLHWVDSEAVEFKWEDEVLAKRKPDGGVMWVNKKAHGGCGSFLLSHGSLQYEFVTRVIEGYQRTAV